MTVQIRAIAYSRVSTDAQERDGSSLDTQERACLELAEAKGWVIVEAVRDTASGFTLERPGIEQVRQSLRQGTVDVVVAYAVDRLSRNQNHIGVLSDEVERAGATPGVCHREIRGTAVGRFILAARAFIAEVEREKITERTTRGKVERARSGRIPQATGKGCFGYVYNPQSGHREVNPYQALVVQHIFDCYAETRSFSMVSNELSESGVPAFSGGRWYPLTIRHVLTNRAYTGKLTYRRTQRVKIRNGTARRARSHVVERPASEWIEIEGACPRIVDNGIWERVKRIIDDPERSRRRPTERFYPLRGRAKCGICGSAMVGQTLTVKGKPYRYYRCRHVYDKNTGRECSARYVRADNLEAATWAEVKRALTRPEVVLRELVNQSAREVDAGEVARLEGEIATLVEQEKRLVRLYTFGDVGEEAIREQAADLSRRRTLVQERRVR